VNIVSQGGSSLIDLFAVPQALYVVTSTALMAFDANDGLQFEHDFSREVTAAAQEGDLVAVADRAAVTPFTQLVPGTETLLVEACASAVIVGGNRFVCGPFDDTNRVFSTYDLDARAAIAQSDSYVYDGIPMRRVPGRDSFVTVDVNLSPSDFHLFDVDSTGKASYVNESPYHGDFPVTLTYAFDATPAARVIQETGLILEIYGSAASPCTSAFPSSCFVKDGALGTLRGAEYFAALTEGGDGTVIGLVAPDRTQEGCQAGCSLQTIDIAARSASVITTYTPMGAGKIVVARSAPSPARTLYVGYDLGGTGAGRGYRVEAIRY